VLLQISTLDFSFISEVHLSDLFSEFASLGVKVELMRNTAVSISVCVQHSSAKLDLLLSSLKDKFNTEVIKPVELLTIRHYDNDTLVKLTAGRSVLLQELNPQTAQVVMMQLK
jgi:aspartate kinase